MKTGQQERVRKGHRERTFAYTLAKIDSRTMEKRDERRDRDDRDQG
jgi:hypothetical protein